MTSIVFNGSYITKKNTGIGVVSKDLANSLSTNKIIVSEERKIILFDLKDQVFLEKF